MASGKGNSSQSDAKEILSQILSHIGELSDALASSEGSSNNSSSVRISDTVEDEVRNVFGPIGRQHISSTTSSSSLGTNRTSNTTQGTSTTRASFAVSPSSAKPDIHVYNCKFHKCIVRYFFVLADWYSDVIIHAHDELSHDHQKNTQVVKEIAINCNNVLKDMIIAFKDEIILSCCLEIVFIDERGNIEDGRGSGVKREALSIFWREFYNSLATGASEKVPAICHDYQQNEWKSIACILVAGFTKFGYFPVTLSSTFISSCLFPEELHPKEWLVESFH